MDGEIRAAVAVKEFAKQGKSIRIGLPNPILDLVTGGRTVDSMGTPHPYRGFIVGAHVLYKTLLVIPIVPVAENLAHRASVDRVGMRADFDVKMIGYKKYVIQGEKFGEDTPINHIDTFALIESFLDASRSEFEDS